MIFLRRKILLDALKLFDLGIMVFSFALTTVAVHSHFDSGILSEFLQMRVKVTNFALFIGFLVVWHVIFSLFRLYHSRRLSTRWEEASDIVKATSAGVLVIFVASLFLKLVMISPGFVLVFWIGSSGLTVLGRLVLRSILERFRLRGRNLRHMLIVGTNPRSIQFARKIEAKPELRLSTHRLCG